jgi:peptidoglycan hydrolase CwlO-like protein
MKTSFGGNMNKKLTAFLAAVLSTACIGVAILAISGAALFNPNGSAAAQSPSQAAVSINSGSNNQAQVQQLQSLVAQYQAREQQYQAREQQYQQQLDAASGQVQQAQQQIQEIQSLLNALQQRGLITITGDGQIVINR